MSFFFPQPRAAPPRAALDTATRPASPASAASNGPISTLDDVLDHEWVLFSPQLSADDSAAYEVLSRDAATASEPVALDLDASGNTLELPAHNGAGSFMAPAAAPAAAAAAAAGAGAIAAEAVQKSREQHDMMERVNQWRLDQSQLVFSELQRLERRFFPQYTDGDEAAAASSLDDPAADAASGELPAREGPRRDSAWSRLTRRVMARIGSFMTLEDDVLQLLFDGELPEKLAARPPQAAGPPERAAPQPSHFARALAYGPPAWDSQVVARVLGELGRAQVPPLPFLRQLLLWNLGLRDLPDPRELGAADWRRPAPPVWARPPGYRAASHGYAASFGSWDAPSFWGDETSSAASTPVY